MIQPLFDLSGKVALVTGASRGLGKAMALALAQAGADVALNARSADKLKEVAGEIEKLGRKVHLAVGDVTDEAQVKSFVDDAHKALGKIDILVNNAGVWEGTFFFRMPKADFDKVISVNLGGTFLVAKAVARVMMKQRSGKIINISSVQGLAGGPEAVAYSAAKAGIIQMTKVMAIEMGGFGVQVNALAPGLFATDMTEHWINDEKMLQDYLARVPLKKYGKPEDLGGAVIFLASKASDHVTGQVVVVDGGETLV